MTVTESKALKMGNRVFWKANINDKGKITRTSWNAVTITWENHHVAIVHHGDMGQIHREK